MSLALEIELGRQEVLISKKSEWMGVVKNLAIRRERGG